MARYIDAEKLSNKVLEAWKKFENKGKDCYVFADIFVPLIVSTPTEEVQPIVRGKCSIAYGMYENRIWCNNCGFIKVITGNEDEYNFCPKCGAIVEKQNEMDGKEKKNERR